MMFLSSLPPFLSFHSVFLSPVGISREPNPGVGEEDAMKRRNIRGGVVSRQREEVRLSLDTLQALRALVRA